MSNRFTGLCFSKGFYKWEPQSRSPLILSADIQSQAFTSWREALSGFPISTWWSGTHKSVTSENKWTHALALWSQPDMQSAAIAVRWLLATNELPTFLCTRRVTHLGIHWASALWEWPRHSQSISEVQCDLRQGGISKQTDGLLSWVFRCASLMGRRQKRELSCVQGVYIWSWLFLKMKSLRHVTHFPYINSGLSEDDACTEADN